MKCDGCGKIIEPGKAMPDGKGRGYWYCHDCHGEIGGTSADGWLWCWLIIVLLGFVVVGSMLVEFFDW